MGPSQEAVSGGNPGSRGVWEAWEATSFRFGSREVKLKIAQRIFFLKGFVAMSGHVRFATQTRMEQLQSELEETQRQLDSVKAGFHLAMGEEKMGLGFPFCFGESM